MRTFMSVPSRDLIESTGPSTASMVPRIRTVGAGCARASDENSDAASSEAAKARVVGEAMYGMATLPRSRVGLIDSKPRAHLAIPGRSHRRGQTVAADADAVGLERAVGQLFHERDNLGSGFQLGLVRRHIGHHRRVRA